MITLMHNALIINEGSEHTGYIMIDGDTITACGHGEAPQDLRDNSDITAIDCHGDMLLPGAIDTHVHFRDPGLTHKGDIATESMAAVAGGVTSYIDMPNTVPATTDMDRWNDKMRHAADVSLANYAFFIGATNDNLHTLLNADYSRIPGIKLFMGSSTGNMLVDDNDMLESLFKQSKAIIAVHAEDEGSIRANKALIQARYPDGGVPIGLHSTLRSTEACFKAAQQAVAMARRYGTRLHLLHISTEAELQLLDHGHNVAHKRITAETCPHYLLFNDSDIASLGARIKCNPAIKTISDRRALLHAIATGLIDTIATDHAPHLPADKQGDLFHAASGMPGVQFSLPLMLSLPNIDPATVVQLMCHNPATIFHIDRRGFLKPGYAADIVRIARLDHPHTIADDDVSSRCGWTPYVGKSVTHRVVSTIVNGHTVYHDGQWHHPSTAQPLTFQQH